MDYTPKSSTFTPQSSTFHPQKLHLSPPKVYLSCQNIFKIMVLQDLKRFFKKKDLKIRFKNLTASLITWGAENKKPIKTMRCNKAELQASFEYTPPPTLWKPSIHAVQRSITCRKTRRMCSTWRLIHFRFLAHSLANARSLGLRRVDDTITVLAAPPAR